MRANMASPSLWQQQLVLPWVVNLTYLARLLPVSVMDWANDFLGVSKTMDDFKGRGWEATDPNAKKQQ